MSSYNPWRTKAKDRIPADTANSSSDRAMAQLYALADCLRKGQHRLATETVSPFPQGLWTCKDREVLFDRAYHPIWQRWRDGRVEAADPYEWIYFDAIERAAPPDDEFFFVDDVRYPYHAQAEGMKRLRAIAASWVEREV
jgi:hypothetical protein